MVDLNDERQDMLTDVAEFSQESAVCDMAVGLGLPDSSSAIEDLLNVNGDLSAERVGIVSRGRRRMVQPGPVCCHLEMSCHNVCTLPTGRRFAISTAKCLFYAIRNPLETRWSRWTHGAFAPSSSRPLPQHLGRRSHTRFS